MLSVDDKCAIRGWRHGGRRKSTEKRCFFYLTICEHEHEVKYGKNRWAEENAGDHERERA